MEKRALIAIVLSFAVFFGYTKVIQIMYPNYGKAAKPTAGLVGPSSAVATGAPAANAGGAVLPISGIQTASDAQPDQILTINTAKYELSYSANRAAFTGVRMKDYPDNQGGAFRFLQAATGKTGVGSMDSILVDDEMISPADFKTTREGGKILSTARAGKISVEKIWEFADKEFGQGLLIALTNQSDAPVRVRYRILTGSTPVVHNKIDMQYDEANWLTADKLTHIRKPAVDKPKSLSEPVIAAAMKSRHFSSILKPAATTGTFSAHVEAYDKTDFGSYLVRSEAVLKPGETLRDGFVWYAGPNRVEDLGPYELDRIVNFGKLDFVAKIVLGGLHLVAGVVKNYGLAIILLTILTNVLFMPLTKTSFMSMRRMQIVQPEMNKIREKYKDNPAKMNEETMALYKRHKVNPMGGCLPMLLQMPIFMGLYVSLSKAPELLGGHFLWIKDLASPDQVKLPFELPMVGGSVHLLPLIMVAAMVVQQKFTAASMASADPAMAQQQKIMMTVMPIMFGFIFYQMPSGLVVYWLTNTIVTTSYQAFLKKTNPVTDVPQVA